ncbi:MAG: ribonucleoside-diphosphate reductase subunit alpha [Gammaproteobacteria bacterium RIFCSPHIGHO2_12_FULL_45_9]|nr:MAG: ribonucleoside-diphosphate reductase subunit alpha [Gammaproteobacteria bacterium RIFCSPHIGHO2_12_FULL_45_9]
MSCVLEQPVENKQVPPRNLMDIQPGLLHVIKRDGRLVVFDPNCINLALKKAFLAVEGDAAAISDRLEAITTDLTNEIVAQLSQRFPTGGTVHIEAIQDKVELALMYAGQHKVARAYVLYREERRRQRETSLPTVTAHRLMVTHPDGSKTPLDTQWLSNLVLSACDKLTHVDPAQVLADVKQNLYDGVAIKDVYKALTLSARTLVEQEPNYSYVTARLLLQELYDEALTGLNILHDLTCESIQKHYQAAFTGFLKRGIAEELLSPALEAFDWDELSHALLPERDQQFTYLGLQTLYDRYFIHANGVHLELPQVFFMRVAMGLAEQEGDQRNQRAIEFYQLLSSFDFMSSTPTLFNSGTCFPQLSSCYLTTVPDSLEGIYNALRDNALLSKYAGGLGNDWTSVRAIGSHIKGTNGKSLGVVPFLNVANATAIAVNQGGKRKGAVCAYLECWHLDVEEFLELRKNTGDERRRTHDMNTANWIPDLFMKRVFEKADWTLFSPNDVPDLHEKCGAAFETAYEAYEAQVRAGTLRGKTIPAVQLWRKMLGMLFETGHPWITFKDACNLRSPQQHVGVIHSSNLCTEITLNTSADEIAVCNLGSINLAQHITDSGELDTEKLRRTVKTAVRMLDNVIDINFYSVPQARNSNLKHRPIGLGIMGFQDALYLKKVPYASEEAVEFADRSQEWVSYLAIEASTQLAEERGAYTSFTGSLWDQGILPIDSIQLLKKNRGEYLDQNTDTALDWNTLRKKAQKGMRNSNVMAIAPTATISNICGVSQSIEPTYQNLFVKSNLSGEFTIINPYLVQDLKALGLWDAVMVHDLKYYNGSVQKIHRIPDELKQRYATAFEIEPKWLIDAASRRQKWIDQAQSLNLYMAEPSGKKLDTLYRMAWIRGLKTTYYLRSLAATGTEKATIHDGALNAVQSPTEPKLCAIDNPNCEACQ